MSTAGVPKVHSRVAGALSPPRRPGPPASSPRGFQSSDLSRSPQCQADHAEDEQAQPVVRLPAQVRLCPGQGAAFQEQNLQDSRNCGRPDGQRPRRPPLRGEDDDQQGQRRRRRLPERVERGIRGAGQQTQSTGGQTHARALQPPQQQGGQGEQQSEVGLVAEYRMRGGIVRQEQASQDDSVGEECLR